jgi:hypothetical protein
MCGFRQGSANSGRGAQRFVREVVGRVRRAGASGPLTLRADSGFFPKYVVEACRNHDVRYSITVRHYPAVKRAFQQIADGNWTPIEYIDNGEAWVGETPYGDGHRLIVRRTKLNEPRPTLFPTYRYHAFITDRVGDPVTRDADHRRPAVVELAIRDLKEGSGLEHRPSGDFGANGPGPCSLQSRTTWCAGSRRWDSGSRVRSSPKRSVASSSPYLTHHSQRAAAPTAPTYFLALGEAVDQLLRASLQTTDLASSV